MSDLSESRVPQNEETQVEHRCIAGKRQATDDLSESVVPQIDVMEGVHCCSLSRSIRKPTRQCYHLVDRSVETTAVGGIVDVADHELLQNDSDVTIGNVDGNSNMTDSSVVDPAERGKTVEDRIRRLNRESKDVLDMRRKTVMWLIVVVVLIVRGKSGRKRRDSRRSHSPA